MRWKRRGGELQSCNLSGFFFICFCPICHSCMRHKWTHWHLYVCWLACPFVRVWLFIALVWHAWDRGEKEREGKQLSPPTNRHRFAELILGDDTEQVHCPQQSSPHPTLYFLSLGDPTQLVMTDEEWMPSLCGWGLSAWIFLAHWAEQFLSQGPPLCCEKRSNTPVLHPPEANTIISLWQPKISLGITQCPLTDSVCPGWHGAAGARGWC